MKIWFNHWFSTAYHLLRLMKEGEDDFHMTGSGTNPDAIYRRACEEWYDEPEGMEDDEYTEFCLDFSKAHSIDLFVPRRGLSAIARAKDRFADAGVRLMVPSDAAVTDVLDDKEKSYEYFSCFIPECVPEYRIARSYDEVLSAIEDLKTEDNRICYKLTVDEGATTFRIIDDSIEGAQTLRSKPGFKVTSAAARNILSGYDFSIPVLVMPYLSGYEISADCLMTGKGPVILPRRKSGSRYSLIELDSEIVPMCRKIMEHMNINVPVNIQFKYENDRPYLLEINPRMSGGLQKACLATGINIPNIAANRIFGVEKDWEYPEKRTFKVANIETPIILG
jgi:carbamoylphosphate synthase large subunit